MSYISQHNEQIRTIGIVVLMAGVIFSSLKNSFSKKPAFPEPTTPGPNKIPLWERFLQIFLIFGTAFYALWQFGIKRFISEEVGKGGDLRPLIITLVMATLFIFGYYMSIVLANRRALDAGLTRQTPRQRYFGYLNIVLIWLTVFVIGLFMS